MKAALAPKIIESGVKHKREFFITNNVNNEKYFMHTNSFTSCHKNLYLPRVNKQNNLAQTRM